jgi:hypothetical protein
MKPVLGIALGLLVTLGIGWVWGVTGRAAANRALRDSQLRSELLEGRTAVLDARLDLYSVNFGNASQHLETAKTLLKQARERIRSTGQEDAAKRIDNALVQVEEAQRLAARLDQAANTKAGDAAQIIDDVVKSTSTR